MTAEYRSGLIDGWLDAYLEVSGFHAWGRRDPSYSNGYLEGRRMFVHGKPLPK